MQVKPEREKHPTPGRKSADATWLPGPGYTW